jgi:copper homeostasis protein (lipoprotein)
MRRYLLRLSVVVFALAAAACDQGDARKGERDELPPLAPPDAPTDPLANLPATFKGTLPCVGCDSRRYHLNVFPDQSYALRVAEDGGATSGRDQMGTWVLSSDHRTMVLKSGQDAPPEFFALKDGMTLRKLDDDAREIDKDTAWDVRRQNRFEPFDVALDMRGSYTLAGNAGTFTDCASGRRWPVAWEGASGDLDAAYHGTRLSPGEPVIVSIQARIASRERAEGAGMRPMLVVDKFVRVFPGQSCSQRYSSAPLEGTEWRLVRVGGTAVAPGAAAKVKTAPSITLEPSSLQFNGTGGCNRLVGGYERNGGKLSFNQAVQTRLACQGGMEIDTAFAQMLPQVRRWRVLGRILELQDESGKSLARFEAGG